MMTTMKKRKNDNDGSNFRRSLTLTTIPLVQSKTANVYARRK